MSWHPIPACSVVSGFLLPQTQASSYHEYLLSFVFVLGQARSVLENSEALPFVLSWHFLHLADFRRTDLLN